MNNKPNKTIENIAAGVLFVLLIIEISIIVLLA